MGGEVGSYVRGTYTTCVVVVLHDYINYKSIYIANSRIATKKDTVLKIYNWVLADLAQ